MQSKSKSRSARLILCLTLIMLSGGAMACSVSIAVSGTEDDDLLQAMATANADLASQVASNEAMISYLATNIPRFVPRGGVPAITPTPYLPVQGAVIIEDGRCCVMAVAGNTIQLTVTFRAFSQLAQVSEMRVRVGGMAFSEREMAAAAWEPFVRQRRYPVHVAVNWVGFYVSVQYRDAQGNMSPVYFDDISVEGMPPTPTISAD